MFAALFRGLSKTRNLFSSLLSGNKPIDENLLDKLEEQLILADISVNTVMELMDSLRDKAEKSILTGEQVREILKKELMQTFSDSKNISIEELNHFPEVILIIGVNGAGKTTTTGKIAALFQKSGKKVMLAACDTYRSGAIEQLSIWAEQSNVSIIKQNTGSDPASIAFDALKSAQAQKFDVLIIDTAGRLHTKLNLMEELKKIKRVLNKQLENAPHQTLLVLDATIGQNALTQAKAFNDYTEITGLIITKLDGTAKGGMIITIKQEIQVPVKFIGYGEALDDIKLFDPAEYISALFSEE